MQRESSPATARAQLISDGALLISTLIPFEGADGEDSTALSVGEMITTVQVLRQKLNSEREETAKRYGKQPVLIPQCEHLWVVSGVSDLFFLAVVVPSEVAVADHSVLTIRERCPLSENASPTFSSANARLSTSRNT